MIKKIEDNAWAVLTVRSLSDIGVNGIFIGEGAYNEARIRASATPGHTLIVKVFAGTDGLVQPVVKKKSKTEELINRFRANPLTPDESFPTPPASFTQRMISSVDQMDRDRLRQQTAAENQINWFIPPDPRQRGYDLLTTPEMNQRITDEIRRYYDFRPESSVGEVSVAPRRRGRSNTENQAMAAFNESVLRGQAMALQSVQSRGEGLISQIRTQVDEYGSTLTLDNLDNTIRRVTEIDPLPDLDFDIEF